MELSSLKSVTLHTISPSRLCRSIYRVRPQPAARPWQKIGDLLSPAGSPTVEADLWRSAANDPPSPLSLRRRTEKTI
nr:hypothetical protein Iba_chr01dCG6870 [Ipomoea batatas]